MEKEMSLTEKMVCSWAVECHRSTNHKYDKAEYSYHLVMVRDVAEKFIDFIPSPQRETAFLACWCHDLIEDARVTYNQVESNAGAVVAEITYILTNEKGRNRKERANFKYYEGIRNNLIACFVKCCDRLANIRYSVANDARTAAMYRKEMQSFEDELGCIGFQPMFDEMKSLLKITV